MKSHQNLESGGNLDAQSEIHAKSIYNVRFRIMSQVTPLVLTHLVPQFPEQQKYIFFKKFESIQLGCVPCEISTLCSKQSRRYCDFQISNQHESFEESDVNIQRISRLSFILGLIGVQKKFHRKIVRRKKSQHFSEDL